MFTRLSPEKPVTQTVAPALRSPVDFPNHRWSSAESMSYEKSAMLPGRMAANGLREKVWLSGAMAIATFGNQLNG